MMTKWPVVVLLLVVALNANARSLSPVDVPDPPQALHPVLVAEVPRKEIPQRSAVEAPPAAPAVAKETELLNSKKASLLASLKGSCKDACQLGIRRAGCECQPDSSTKLCQLACEMTEEGPDCECTVVSRARPSGLHEVRAVVADKIVISVIRPKNNETTIESTTPTPIKTTTLSLIEEFCKEACEAGIGGPECDCADHPIG